MIVVIALFAALASAQLPSAYMTYDAIPGTDFVGFGYDARFAEPRDALTLPMLDYSWTKGKTYIYPTDPNTIFRVPDQLYVRTVAYTEADAYLYDTIDQVTMALQISLGFGFDKSANSNTTQQNCVTSTTPSTNQTNTNCSTTSTNATGTKFSVGANLAYQRNTMSSSETVIVENTEKTQLYNIFLDSLFITANVKDDMSALANLKFSGKTSDPSVQPQKFFTFIEKWGTHYIVSSVMGGQVRSTSMVVTQISQVSNQFGISASVVYASNQDALAAGGAAFSSNLDVTASFNFNNAQNTIQTQTTTNWYLLGGDSNSVNLLDASNSSTAIRAWKPTIVKNPVPVAFRLREVATLFTDFLLRAEMANAIDVYLTMDTSDIISLEINLETNTNTIVKA
jgi:hypothetical protein